MNSWDFICPHVNVTRLILNHLNDGELYKLVQVCKYFAGIIGEDEFWKTRLVVKYGYVSPAIPIIKDEEDYICETWEELYVAYRIREKYGRFVGNVSEIVYFKPASVTMFEYSKWMDSLYDIVKMNLDMEDSYMKKLTTDMDESNGTFIPGALAMLRLHNKDSRSLNSYIEDITEYQKYMFLHPENGKNCMVNLSDAIDIWKGDYFLDINGEDTREYVFCPDFKVFGSRENVYEYVKTRIVPLGIPFHANMIQDTDRIMADCITREKSSHDLTMINVISNNGYWVFDPPRELIPFYQIENDIHRIAKMLESIVVREIRQVDRHRVLVRLQERVELMAGKYEYEFYESILRDFHG